MDYRYFEELSDDDAQRFLELYLEHGKQRLVEMGVEGTTVPTTVEGIVDVLIALSREVKLAELDGRAETNDFDLDSRNRIVVTSYVLGEAIRRMNSVTLKWSIGERSTAVQNQPVISGFLRGMQLAPLLITENLMRRILTNGDPCDEDRAAEAALSVVTHWLSWIGE